MAGAQLILLLVAALAASCRALPVADVLETDMQRHPELDADSASGRRLLQTDTFDWASLVPEGGFQKVSSALGHTSRAKRACCCQL